MCQNRFGEAVRIHDLEDSWHQRLVKPIKEDGFPSKERGPWRENPLVTLVTSPKARSGLWL